MIENESNANIKQDAGKAERPAVGVETNVRADADLLARIITLDKHVYEIRLNGEISGFPEGSIFVNYALAKLARLQAQYGKKILENFLNQPC